MRRYTRHRPPRWARASRKATSATTGTPARRKRHAPRVSALAAPSATAYRVEAASRSAELRHHSPTRLHPRHRTHPPVASRSPRQRRRAGGQPAAPSSRRHRERETRPANKPRHRVSSRSTPRPPDAAVPHHDIIDTLHRHNHQQKGCSAAVRRSAITSSLPRNRLNRSSNSPFLRQVEVSGEATRKNDVDPFQAPVGRVIVVPVPSR